MNPQRKRTYYDSDRIRQARLRERRKEQGWKRVSIWLSPDQVDSLETMGGEPWLGRTVKNLLESAVVTRQRQPTKQAALFVVPKAIPDTGKADFSVTVKKGHSDDKAALCIEVDRLKAQGLSWNEIARRWNEQGRRTDKGKPFIGHNVARDWRKWKGAAE